jgi:transcriptional regulator with XRE-family HTH domain
MRYVSNEIFVLTNSNPVRNDGELRFYTFLMWFNVVKFERQTYISYEEIRLPTFGELLRRLRGSRSQKQVAADLEMPITTLSTLENQSLAPRASVLKRFADYYGVPLSYFYPPQATQMTPSDTARAWLQSLRDAPTEPDTIAFHGPPEYPDEIKKQFAAKIRQKKNG